MANEAEIINNPDSTPGAVSTGYQLQNTNLVAQRTGIDKTYVSGGAGTVTVEISGPVDVNGVLYNIKSQTVLTPPAAGRYYITLQGAGQYLTPKLGTSAGTFDPLKNARYDSSGYRVLNWVIYFDGTNCYANRLITPESEHTQIEDLNEPEEVWITANGNWIAPRSKYYTIYITGCGGDGIVSGPFIDGGIYGVSGSTGIKRIWIDAGDVWTAAFTTGSGNATTFTDGTTTLSAGNQGGSVSGCDITHTGGGGHRFVSVVEQYGFNGGASFWGDGGVFNQSGIAYGSGGGSGSLQPLYSNGAGKQGVIRVVG